MTELRFPYVKYLVTPESNETSRYVYYSHEWDTMPFGLLGQASVFSRFDVRFRYKAKEIVLTGC